MPTVIASQPGRVVVIPDAEAAPLPFAMSGWGGAAFKAIVTEVSGSQREAFQASPAFARAVYADSFGRMPGQLRVAGVAFADACEGDSRTTGLEYVRDYYDRNCASARAEPVVALLGTTGACRELGFLVGLDAAANQAETRLSSFSMTLLTVPRRYS